MVIPRSLREEAGVAEGTLMKVAVVEGDQFLMTPQLAIDRSVLTDSRKSRKQAFVIWARLWPNSGKKPKRRVSTPFRARKSTVR